MYAQKLYYVCILSIRQNVVTMLYYNCKEGMNLLGDYKKRGKQND